MRLPIPNDWNGTDYANRLVCWPASKQWDAILLGLVTTIQRGWYWDERTGSILDIQQTASDIISLNTDSEGVIMGCSDLVATLEEIRNAIQAIETQQIDIAVSSSSSASSSAEINQNIINLAGAFALSQSWSESIAIATSSVEVINNVNLTIGPVSPSQPPVASQEPETGISTTPVDFDSYCDSATYIVDYAIAWFNILQDMSVGIGNFAVSVYFGLAAEIFAGLQVLGIPVPITPATVIATVASELASWALQGAFEANAALGRQILEDNRQSLICTIYLAAQDEEDTGTIREFVKDELQGFGATTAIINVMMPIFNPAVMALIYYVSPQVSIPQAAGDCGNCLG